MNSEFPENIIPTEFIEAIDSQDFTKFLKQIGDSPSPLLTVTLPIAPIDPLAALELNPDYEEKFYWDHPDNKISISAAGKVRELKATGIDRFEEIAQQTAGLKGEIDAYTAVRHSMAGPLFLGGYSFDNHNIGRVWKKFGAARFVLPEWMLVKSEDLHLLTLTIDKKNSKPHDIYQQIISRITEFIHLSGEVLSNLKSETTDSGVLCTLQSPDEHQAWIRKVELAREMIREKRFEKIVLARPLTVESKSSPVFTHITYKLREKYPECFNFLVQKDSDTAFVGATPERLASFRNNTFRTEGLAGSTSRGKSALEDAALAQKLMKSRKDRSEHEFVIRAINDNLKKYSKRINHPKKPEIKKLNNVQHLFTPISASIKKGVQIHELISEMHPTPAVGGFPRDEAVSHIYDIEQLDRGWYAAPIGWFNLNGWGEFAVAIRSALLHKNRAVLYAGCGIVADSDPEKEWKETILKFRPMLESLSG
ncbi:isochorismate synthase [Rhodohalobacter mucosus]|uniref:isochorismate synthase n=1 Tax=Rhodohalobacter mucosus TaxID=2079485 RepID=A0A316TQV5_9BACT|nr:isochorismate synthase [Rhodohalobacter mucosus]PWN07003.1 isochorismate synthase [Rhodohalobacter mucosus]